MTTLRYLPLLLALALVGCQQRRDAEQPDADLRARMAAVQAELQAMQEELGDDLRRGRGRGTYADAPYAIEGTETVLERLHRTELALTGAQEALDDKTRSIIALRRENGEQEQAISALAAKAERLDRAEASRITAIQERNATLEDFEDLRQRLVSAELARLERERDFYDLVTEIIRLDPGHTQDFFALQQRMKELARNLPEPADLEAVREAVGGGLAGR